MQLVEQPETQALIQALKTHLSEQGIQLCEVVVNLEGTSYRGATCLGVRISNIYDNRPKKIVVDTNISDMQRRVLDVLAEEYNGDMNCFYIRGIAHESGLDERQARLAVRALARKGLAVLERGLFNEDGEVAGSGYRATQEGAMLVNGCVNKEKCDNLADMITGECQSCWDARRVFGFIADWGDYKKGDTVTREDIGDGAIFKELYFGTEGKGWQDIKIKDATPVLEGNCKECDHPEAKCVC